MKASLYISAGLILLLTACADNKGGGSGGGSGPLGLDGSEKSGNSGGGNSGGQPGQQFTESYRLSLNGCDTGNQVFTGSTQDEARRRMCEGLQNDKLNYSCAESLRFDRFYKRCYDYAWNPIYESQPSRPYYPPTPQRDYAKEDKLREKLNFVLLNSYTIDSAVTVESRKLAYRLGEEMFNCGLSLHGPKCLGTYTYSNSSSFVEIDGKFALYSVIYIEGVKDAFGIIYFADQMDPSPVVSTAQVVQILKPRATQSLNDYLNDKSAVTPLLTLSFAKDLQKTAWERLKDPRDIRELYHLSRLAHDAFMRSSDSRQQDLTKLENSIRQHKLLIGSSTNSQYQKEILNLMTSYLGASTAGVVEVAEQLLNAKDPLVQEMAAVYVLDGQPTKLELKPAVLKALYNQNQSANIRRLAVIALSKTTRTVDEDNKIIAKLSDSESTVRQEVAKVVDKMKLTDDHYESLNFALTTGEWSARRNAATFIGRINSQQALTGLIEKLNEREQIILNDISAVLDKKIFTAADIPALEKHLTTGEWNARRLAIKYLAKIPESTPVLLNQLNEREQIILNDISSVLDNRPLSVANLQVLEKHLATGSWSTRRLAIKYLAKISESTPVLLNHLNEREQIILNDISAVLDKRTLTNDHLKILRSRFSGDWSARRLVARYLGTIKTPESLATLQDLLMIENENTIKNDIIAAMKLIKDALEKKTAASNK